MITYSVAQVESITGISSHKLRIWERRYNFLKPNRTSSNIRSYTEDDLKMLINIGILSRNGIRISRIDKMKPEEITDEVMDIVGETNADVEDEISSLIISTINLDEELFARVFQRQLIQHGFVKSVTGLIYPFLTKLGILWGTSKIIPAQEHFITNLIRQKIIAAIDTLSPPPADAPRLLLFLFEGEMHELSLLLAAFIAKNNGWRVFYLGQNVPFNNVISTSEMFGVDLMVSMITTPRISGLGREIKRMTEEAGVPLVLSGRHDNMTDITDLEHVIIVNSPEEFTRILADYSKK